MDNGIHVTSKSQTVFSQCAYSFDKELSAIWLHHFYYRSQAAQIWGYDRWMYTLALGNIKKKIVYIIYNMKKTLIRKSIMCGYLSIDNVSTTDGLKASISMF